jgi:hypothetical protein
LVEGAVADSDRVRAGVPGEIVACRLGEIAIPYMIWSDPSSVASTSAMNSMNSSASQSSVKKCSACRVKVVSRIQV